MDTKTKTRDAAERIFDDLSDRRMLHGVDEDLFPEIKSAIEGHVRSALSAPTGGVTVVPDGWQLVPKPRMLLGRTLVLDSGMVKAGRSVIEDAEDPLDDGVFIAAFAAALSAAPTVAGREGEGASLAGPGCTATPEPQGVSALTGEHPSRTVRAERLLSALVYHEARGRGVLFDEVMRDVIVFVSAIEDAQ